MTTAEILKSKIIELLEGSLNEHEQDIETGVSDGIYEPETYEEYLENIAKARKLIEEFKAYKPSVWAYISGGVLQGASASESMEFNLFDQDNYEEMSEEDQEAEGTPQQWDDRIKADTAANKIVGIF